MNRSDIEEILGTVYGRQTDEHIELETLVAFVDSVAENRPLTAAENEIKAHVDACNQCQQIYEEQLALLELGSEPALPPEISLPSFNLNFLAENSTARDLAAASNVEQGKVWQDWAVDSLGRLVIELSNRLVESLQPPPQLAFAKSSGKPLFELAVEDQEDISVKIAAKQNRHYEELCDLAISVGVPSRGGWPMLANMQVDVRRSSLLLKQAKTDAFGEAVVTGIRRVDLPKLVFVVDPTNEE